MEIKQNTVYIAKDGKEFSNIENCFKYEEEVLDNIIRLPKISLRLNFLFNELINKNNIVNEVRIDAKIGESKIFAFQSKVEEWFEMDECLDGYIDSEDYDAICEIIYREYKFNLSVPYWYWSK